MTYLIVLYSIAMVSFIWARFKFFELKNSGSITISLAYDPIVALHILVSYYYFITDIGSKSLFYIPLAALLYTLSLILFLSSIRVARKLDFAFSDSVGNIITNGSFGAVRHPLYLSYSICWFTSAALFDSIVLWITLAYLLSFYFLSARREEKVIMQSKHSKEYAAYKKQVGMFFPRAKQWKNWLLELLQPSKK